MANALKQNLRYQKADLAWRKKTYKGLSVEEKKMVKLTEKQAQLEKEINTFWRTAPRNNNGAVDWSQCLESDLDWFEFVDKEKEKTEKAIDRLEEKGLSQDSIMNIFKQINTKSLSF